MAFIVVYDANAMYGNTPRDLLIRIGRAGLVQAKWTEDILDEALGNLARNRPAELLAHGTSKRNPRTTSCSTRSASTTGLCLRGSAAMVSLNPVAFLHPTTRPG